MTVQFPEWITIAGARSMLGTLPLEPFLSTLSQRPHFDDNTACYRGYQGYWGISDRKLWLVELIGSILLPSEAAPGSFTPLPSTIQSNDVVDPFGGTRPPAPSRLRSALEHMFPGRGLPIWANWFSGNLAVLCGEPIGEPMFGWDEVFPHRRVFSVDKGQILTERRERIKVIEQDSGLT